MPLHVDRQATAVGPVRGGHGQHGSVLQKLTRPLWLLREALPRERERRPVPGSSSKALSRADAAWCRTHSAPLRRLPGLLDTWLCLVVMRLTCGICLHICVVFARTSAASCEAKGAIGIYITFFFGIMRWEVYVASSM
jgi:hypothetical protein